MIGYNPKIKDNGQSSTGGYIYLKGPASVAHKTLCESGRKIVKCWIPGCLRETVSRRNGTNKTWTIVISISILTEKESHPYAKNFRQLMNAEEWENYPFPWVSPLIGYPIQNGLHWTHIQTNSKNTLSRLYLYNCVYITTIIKEAIDLSVVGDTWEKLESGVLEGAEGRREKAESDVIIF